MAEKLYEIKDCFKFLCPKMWEDLTSTGTENIRHCNTCDKKVYRADTEKELFKLSNQKKCVAFQSEDFELMGEINIPFKLKPL